MADTEQEQLLWGQFPFHNFKLEILAGFAKAFPIWLD